MVGVRGAGNRGAQERAARLRSERAGWARPTHTPPLLPPRCPSPPTQMFLTSQYSTPSSVVA